MSMQSNEAYETRLEIFKASLRDCAHEELKQHCVHVLSDAMKLHDAIIRRGESRSWIIYQMIWQLQLSLETSRRAIFDYDVSEREERLVRAAIVSTDEWMEKNRPAKPSPATSRKAAPKAKRGAKQ